MDRISMASIQFNDDDELKKRRGKKKKGGWEEKGGKLGRGKVFAGSAASLCVTECKNGALTGREWVYPSWLLDRGT